MKTPKFVRLFVSVLVTAIAATTPVLADKEKNIFDGKTLEGWDGDPKFWSVKDGAIVG